jgi:hypothetical protein
MSIGIVKNGEVSKLHKVYKPIKLIIPNLLFDELVTGVLSGEGIINIDDSITSIGSHFLYKIPSPGLCKVTANKVTSVANYGMSECYIDEVNIGSKATINSTTLTIGSYAFYNSILKKVVLPENTAIGERAFYLDYSAGSSKIKSLTDINTKNIISVGAYAFYNQRGIEILDLSNVTSMGTYAFATVTTLSDNSPDLTTVIFDKLTNIPNRAFNNQTNISSITFGSVTTIGEYVFNNSKITEISNNCISTIAQGAFKGCTLLEEVNLPALTKFTSTDVFNGCTSLRKVDLGVSLITLDNSRTFSGCTSLDTLIIRKTNGVPGIFANNTLLNTPINSGTGYIYVPRELIESYKAASSWASFVNQFRAIEDYPDICGST